MNVVYFIISLFVHEHLFVHIIRINSYVGIKFSSYNGLEALSISIILNSVRDKKRFKFYNNPFNFDQVK